VFLGNCFKNIVVKESQTHKKNGIFRAKNDPGAEFKRGPININPLKFVFYSFFKGYSITN
jgi:hypothetical protein